MTQPPPDEPVQELQRMKFEEVQKDGRIAVYRALVKNSAQPDTTFSMTVTAGSPRDGKEEAALQKFLNEMTSAFTLLDASPPAYADDEEDEPFDPATQVMLQPGVADTAREDLVGFAVAVNTTAYPVPGTTTDDPVPVETMPEGDIALRATAGPPRYGREHRWTTGRGKTWMTVVVVGGQGWIRKPWQGVSHPHNYHRYVQTLWVGSNNSVTYNFYGNAYRA
jgi:hypothetical protein